MLVENLIMLHVALVVVALCGGAVGMVALGEERDPRVRRAGTWIVLVCFFAGFWEAGNVYALDTRIDKGSKEIAGDAVVASFFLAPRSAWEIACYIFEHRGDIWEWTIQTTTQLVCQLPGAIHGVLSFILDGVYNAVVWILSIPAFVLRTARCIVLADCFQS